MEEAIRQELRQDERTWTAAQLAAWVAERFGVRLTPDALKRRLPGASVVLFDDTLWRDDEMTSSTSAPRRARAWAI